MSRRNFARTMNAAPATSAAGARSARASSRAGQEDRRERREPRLGGAVTEGDRAALGELYQARFEPPAPQLQAQGGAVRIHYPHFLFFQRGWGMGTMASVRLERVGLIGLRSSIHALREAMVDGKACGCVT